MSLDAIKPLAQARHNGDEVHHQPRQFGAWLTSADLVDFIPCKNQKAVYQWLRRRGLNTGGRVRIAKVLIERALRKKRQARVMHPNSLHALRASQSQKAR